MSLLREIQETLLRPGQDIAPVLLKLRLLASRLGSEQLEDWVKYELEGYPDEVELPPYRKIGVSYTATFSGPFGSGIQNAPIPPYLIKKFAGDHWISYGLRQSVSGIDSLVAGDKGSGTFSIEASNLILALQGKIYKDYACNSVSGTVSKAALVELQNAVRAKVLELTIQLERSVPAAAEIALGPPTAEPQTKDKDAVTQITKQIIHGNYTSISNNVQGDQLNLNIKMRDINALTKALSNQGIGEADAEEFGEILVSEEPESQDEPFGARAKQWIVRNIAKAANGTWAIGITAATRVLTEAALRYYGLK